MRYRLSDILVTKRDGRKVPFNDTKICQAVKAAYLDNLPAQDTAIGASLTDDEKASSYAEHVMENVLDKLEALEPVSLTIEQIQDIVVKTLLEDKSEVGKRVAENYISYRAKRTQVRTINSDINKAINTIITVDSANNDDKRENANINTDCTMGALLKVGSTVLKEFNLNNLFNERYSKMHREGRVHLHDLDLGSVTFNCLHLPLSRLLRCGYSTGHGFLRTPATIQSASSLTCIAIQSSQNDAFGGQAIPSLDFALAPYTLKSLARNLLECAVLLQGIPYEDLKNQWLADIDELIADQIITREEQATHLSDENIWLPRIRNCLAKRTLEPSENLVYTVKKLDATDPESIVNLFLEMPAIIGDKITSFKTLLGKSIYDVSAAYAIGKTIRDTKQAMEAMVHNLCTMQSRAGSQTPFSSVNFGLDTSWAGRLVSKSLMDAIDAGLGLGETAIFPIAIMKLKKGITDKGSPNYDLFQQSCRVSAKRLFPNWVNVDAPFNLPYYNPDKPRTHIASMGCADGNETVIWKYGDRVQLTSFTDLWGFMSLHHSVKDYSEIAQYVDSEHTPLQIYDSSSPDKFVQVKKVIRNKTANNWRTVKFSNGRVLDLTGDHPLPVLSEDGSVTRTYVDDLKASDKIPLAGMCNFGVDNVSDNCDEAWLLGMILCDGMYASSYVAISIGADETDICEKIQRTASVCYPGIGTRIVPRHRGVKGNYTDIFIFTGSALTNTLAKRFNGRQKLYRNVPADILNRSEAYRAAFLAGMIDADGYINDARTNGRVQIGSTNKALALEQAALAQSLGAQAKVYCNHYSSKHSGIRYRVEFFVPPQVIPYLSSQKKISKIGELNGVPACTTYVEVCDITAYESDKPSFDVETVSDRFDLSGIQVFNCRTRVISNDYDPEHQQVEGRGNLFWTTVNLPYLALEAKEELIREKGLNYHLSDVLPDDLIPTLYEKIIAKVDTTVDDVLDFSLARFEIIAKRKAMNYPFIMCQHEYVGSEKLRPEDEIRNVLKEGTISIGLIGLAETLIALMGKHHGESDLAQEYGLKLVRHMRERTDRATKELGFNFSLMGSPAEGCTGRLCRCIKKRWGVLPGITDKDYLVNSSMLPPKFKTTVTNKVLKEVPYHALENAGSILYLEQSANVMQNLEGFEQLVTFMADKGAGYFAINHPVTRDPICGYVGPLRSDGTCPRCGRKSGEGVSVEKLLSLHAYSPDPEYAVTAAQLDQDEAVSNDVDF